MLLLPETQQALGEVTGTSLRGGGQHATARMEVGSQGLFVGSENYDPVRHSPHDIDPLNPFALVYGEDQVSLVMPDKPLTMNIVVDATERQEVPSVSGLKTRLADVLQEAMEAAMPGINDRVYSYVISDGQSPLDVPIDQEVIEVEQAADAELEVAHIGVRGLTIVISDFSRWRTPGMANALENVVAIKANHPAERYIPANIGHVSLGGWLQVDTGKKRHLAKANDDLERNHAEIMRNLSTKGAVVAPVVADPRFAEGFDAETVDRAIVSALEQLI